MSGDVCFDGVKTVAISSREEIIIIVRIVENIDRRIGYDDISQTTN